MKNIEFKVRVENFRSIKDILKRISAKHAGLLKQNDTYFNSRTGRLKIREIGNDDWELIYYQRPNRNNSQESNYQIVVLSVEQGQELKDILAITNQKKVKVKKIRELWTWKNTRIHLDQVKGLGNFLELETVQKGISNQQARQQHTEIKQLLDLDKYQTIKVSYSDLAIIKK